MKLSDIVLKVRKSERLDLYHTYTKKLLDVRISQFTEWTRILTCLKSGRAYRCFCSPDRLQETSERLARAGSNSTYDKACLNLTEEEVARRVRAGQKSVVRLNVSESFLHNDLSCWTML